MINLVRRRLASRRGNIMVHVLVTAIIVMIIAAGLMKLVMVRYVAIQRVNDGGNNKRVAEAAVAAVVGRWSIAGRSCMDLPAGGSWGWTSGPAAGCACAMSATITVNGTSQAVTVTSTAGTGTQCRLSVNTGT